MTNEQVLGKLAIIRDNLEKLEQLPQGSLEEFVADFRNVDSALHRLQTGIQALIDIASYVTARRGLGTPASSADSLVGQARAVRAPTSCAWEERG